jgi:L-aminopeptidase/D-esterase-like protein
LTNTTLVLVATNARLTKVLAHRLAERAHDGMALAIRPIHTSHDGDSAFGVGTGRVAAPFDWVANIGAEMTAAAIRSAVRHAASVDALPGLLDTA